MKRVVFTGCVTLASGLILAACLPAIPKPLQVALSSPTPVLNQTPSPEFTATETSPLPTESTSTSTLIPTTTFTPIPSFTSTIGGNETTAQASPATAVGNTETPAPLIFTPTISLTGTGAPFGLTAVIVTDTATPFGSLSQPNTIYGPAHIQNNSHLQVDLSLHCTTSKGLEIVIEFNHVRNVVTMLPQGNYVYVMYMAGRQSVGSFSYFTSRKLNFMIFQDGVVIQ